MRISDWSSDVCSSDLIKRCSAPCVGRIGGDDYAALVAQATEFLGGRSQAIQRDLAERMEAASAALEFAKAAIYRDRIRALTHIPAHQDIDRKSVGEGKSVSVRVDLGGRGIIKK